MLLPKRPERVHTEASKYVRNEFGDNNPSWLVAANSNNGHVKARCESRESGDGKVAPAELAVSVPMRDCCGADQ